MQSMGRVMVILVSLFVLFLFVLASWFTCGDEGFGWFCLTEKCEPKLIHPMGITGVLLPSYLKPELSQELKSPGADLAVDFSIPTHLPTSRFELPLYILNTGDEKISYSIEIKILDKQESVVSSLPLEPLTTTLEGGSVLQSWIEFTLCEEGEYSMEVIAKGNDFTIEKRANFSVLINSGPCGCTTIEVFLVYWGLIFLAIFGVVWNSYKLIKERTKA